MSNLKSSCDSGFQRQIFLITISTFCLMIFYEAVKQIFFPDITIWLSNTLTICFVTLLSCSIPYCVLTKHDVTEERLTKKSLQESEERLQFVLEGSQLGFWDWNIETGEVFRNTHWAEMLGYTIEEVEHNVKQWTDLHHPDDRAMAWQSIQDHLEGKTSAHKIEYRMLTKDGQYKWILDQAKIVSRDSQGKPLRMSGTHTDISDRKHVERKLHENQERYKKAQRLGKVGNWEYNIRTREFWGSEEAKRIYGFNPDNETFTTDEVENCIPEREMVHRALIELIENEKEYNLEFDILTKNTHEKKTIISLAELEKDLRGNPIKISGVIQDITKRRQADAALKKSEEQLRAIFESAVNVSFIITDAQAPDPLILEFSPGAEKIFGYQKKEILGKPISIIHSANDVKNFFAIYKNVREGKAGFSGEATLVRKSGEKFPALFTTQPLSNEKGEIYAALEISFDFSEQKRLKEQLLQAQKMESVGRLAGGVAHDFNNMLSVIMGNVELILDDMDCGSPFISSLHEIYKAAERSANLTSQLLAFARKQTIAPKVINLNKTVEGLLTMLKRLTGEDIELIWLPSEKLWPIKIDPYQIDQILVNLCLNARDAVKGIGKVTISTNNIALDEEYSSKNTGFNPGEYAVIVFSDNGCGMDDKILANLFEPFFTTKDISQGSGLGLATVYGIIKQNKGFINVYSKPDEGTTFKIYLPRYNEITEEGQKNSSVKKSTKGHETILLVEDEKTILKMTTMMLERLGYTVLAAPTPREAIRIVEEGNFDRIDLLMTDVVMPNMNGRDLSLKLLELYPNLQCLFMSGYTSNVIAHRGILDEGVHFINKPFSKQDMAIKIRDILDQ